MAASRITQQVPAEATQSPQLIAQRYEVKQTLGFGGMARVYRVIDVLSGRALALKQLSFPAERDERASVEALFEREFHTLTQLTHPRVIAVYDYGVDAATGPYYTMELLDGGDLRDRVPLPWRDACTLFFDVCSSLALLHSRRLLHRDISPRNIRCTRDGKAKLIDFGAMTPMGSAGMQLVGTPAFTPPEVVQRSTLDERADLFSLGATLYYALTGSVPYPARTFSEAIRAWSTKPLPPSSRVAGIPAQLDDLVMFLCSVEPATRPRTAFEVMQRLAAIAGLACSEPEGVSRAYLSTPVLVGRQLAVAELRQKSVDALAGRGGAVIVRGAAGLGRSRILDACALDAKTLGATVLRARATAAGQADFSVALGLIQHLLQAVAFDAWDQYPELFDVQAAPDNQNLERNRSRVRLRNVSAMPPEQLRQAICRVMLAISEDHPLLLAVDDAHRIDEPSASVLAALVDQTRTRRLLLAATAVTDGQRPTPALEALLRRGQEIALEPLTRRETSSLFSSVFGDVPNVGSVAEEIHNVAHGNPRQSLDLAQHLVDEGIIVYAAGTWTLPRRLKSSDLPASAEAAIRARYDRLEPLPRFLAEAQALAFNDSFRHEDYHALRPDAGSRAVDRAISDLLSHQVLIGDGRTYALSSPAWNAVLVAGLSPEHLVARHRALAQMYSSNPGLGLTYHLFAGGCDEQGLDTTAGHFTYEARFDVRALLHMNIASMGPTYAHAVQSAERLGRPPREVNELRRLLLTISVASEVSFYDEVGPAWLAQLEHDSGLGLWRQDIETTDSGERLTRALTRAHERYTATPERERVYRVDEAIRLLTHYVACAIAIGAKTKRVELLDPLPELLEPFVPLSPILQPIWQSALASRETDRDCRYLRARARWIEAHGTLLHFTGAELQHAEIIRNAVAYALGMTDAMLGLSGAAGWADGMDDDPLQKLSAVYLRKVVRLEQGDWDGAERLRRRAELMALQERSPQMFASLLTIELAAHADARDLAGMKQVMAQIEPLAQRHPGWRPHLHLAEARFELVRGDYVAAKRGFERCIEEAALDPEGKSRALVVWVTAHCGMAEVLLALDLAEDARACIQNALTLCHALEIEVLPYELARPLALAEAKLGNHAAAIEGLDAVIDAQNALGITGLKLGLTYEARAQIAIWSHDEAAFERYANLTAREYRYGARCPLGARYERLANDARRIGFQSAPALEDIDATTIVESTHNR